MAAARSALGRYLPLFADDDVLMSGDSRWPPVPPRHLAQAGVIVGFSRATTSPESSMIASSCLTARLWPESNSACPASRWSGGATAVLSSEAYYAVGSRRSYVPKSGPQLGPQLERHVAAAKHRGKPVSISNLPEPTQLLLPGRQGVGGSNPPCSTLILNSDVALNWRECQDFAVLDHNWPACGPQLRALA